MKNRKRRPSLLAALCTLTLFTLLFSVIGMTWAKYVTHVSNQGEASAKPFYFSSDKLCEEGKLSYSQVEISAGESSGPFTFTLKNYEDDMRVTTDAIEYSAVLTPASGEARTVAENTTIQADEGKDTPVTVTVQKSDFIKEDGSSDTAVLSVTTAKPYRKTLSVRLALSQVSGNVTWDVSDESGAVSLTLAGGTGEQVTVVWPEGLVPDPTSSIFASESGAAVSKEQRRVSFTAENGKSYALSFLKTNESGTFQKEDFILWTQ